MTQKIIKNSVATTVTVLCKAHHARLQTWPPFCSNSDRFTR